MRHSILRLSHKTTAQVKRSASSLSCSAQLSANSRAERGPERDVLGERLSLLTGSAQAWGSARRVCAALPGIKPSPLTPSREAFVPKVTANDLKGNVRCQHCCNSHLDKEKGISGCPSGAWRSVGFPRAQLGISFLISAQQGGDRRGLNTGESHQSP